MDIGEFQKAFSSLTNFRKNRFHPLVWITGDPQVGENVYVGGMSEINVNGARVVIGDDHRKRSWWTCFMQSPLRWLDQVNQDRGYGTA